MTHDARARRRGGVRGGWFGLVVVAAVALSLQMAAPADAATPVPACIGTTSTPVPLPSLTLTGAREADLLAGKAVPLYDSSGVVNGGTAVPACVARIENGDAVSEWAYCTDYSAATCLGLADPRQDLVTQNPKFDPIADPLGPEKELVIAHLAQNGFPDGGVTNQLSHPQRQRLQSLIWCVSEALSGVKVAGAAQLGGWCVSNFDANDFDAVLALVPAAPVLDIAPENPGTLLPGAEARFVLQTNVFAQSIAVTAVGPGVATLRVCGGPGVLTGNELVVAGTDASVPVSVTLCAVMDIEGTLSLDVEVVAPQTDNLVWTWNGDQNCQVFATFSPARAIPMVDAAAIQAQVPQVPTIPTTPIVPTTPTAPTTPTVPLTPTVPTSPTSPTAPIAPNETVPTVPEVPTGPDPATPVTPTSPTGPGEQGAPVTPVAPTTPGIRPIDRAPRLRVTKRATVTRTWSGGRIGYRIVVRNAGTTRARTVQVCDLLPDRAAVARRSAGARLVRGQVCWSIASIQPGSSVVRSLVLRVDATAPTHRLINRVRVRAGGRTWTAGAPVQVRARVRPIVSRVTG